MLVVDASMLCVSVYRYPICCVFRYAVYRCIGIRYRYAVYSDMLCIGVWCIGIATPDTSPLISLFVLHSNAAKEYRGGIADEDKGRSVRPRGGGGSRV